MLSSRPGCACVPILLPGIGVPCGQVGPRRSAHDWRNSSDNKKMTTNQWKSTTANVADLLDFFDFFLIGYVTAALTKEWSLTYWQGGAILLASGSAPRPERWSGAGSATRSAGAPYFLVVGHDLAGDRRHGLHARRGRVCPGLAVPGVLPLLRRSRQCWIFTIDFALVQEFVPLNKRGWVSALITTLLPGGSLLAGIISRLAAAVHRLARLVRRRVVAARTGADDPLLGAGIAALADADGPVRRGAPLARLGADDRSERDRIAAARRRPSRPAGSTCSSTRAGRRRRC